MKLGPVRQRTGLSGFLEKIRSAFFFSSHPPVRSLSLAGLWMHESDPGLLRLMQAVKTSLAVLVTLLFFLHASLQTRLLAAIGAGFLIQCTSTGTVRRRQLTMLLSGLAMIVSMLLAAGLFVDQIWGQRAILLIIAFGVFYARRFLPDQSTVLVYVFIMCLLSTVEPAGWHRAISEAGGLAGSLAIAFCIYFLVAPPDPHRAFVDCLSVFLARVIQMLQSLELALRHESSAPIAQAKKLFRRLRDTLAFNQQLIGQWHIAGNVTDPLLRQYEAEQAMEMAAGSIGELVADVPARADCAAPSAEWRTRLADAVEHVREGYAALLQTIKSNRPIDFRPTAQPAPTMHVDDPHCPPAEPAFSAWVALRQLHHLQERIGEHFADETVVGIGGLDAKRPSLLEDLRTPLRAVVSVVIAMSIAWLFSLERAYWAVLVSILLVNGTWGENTRKGLTRFIVTVIGCAVASGFLDLTHAHRDSQMVLMIATISLAAYFRTTNYGLLTFFVSVYVIILFSLTGRSPQHIFLVRSYETCIGCAVALVASLIVPAPRSSRQWRSLLASVWRLCRKVTADALAELSGQEMPCEGHSAELPADVASLMNELRALRLAHQSASYEGVLALGAMRRRQQSMQQARRLAHRALAFAEAVRAPHGRMSEQVAREHVDELQAKVLGGFPRLSAVDGKACKPAEMADCIEPALNWNGLRMAAQQEDRLSPDDIAWLVSVFYYAQRICQPLAEPAGVADGEKIANDVQRAVG